MINRRLIKEAGDSLRYVKYHGMSVDHARDECGHDGDLRMDAGAII